MMHGVRKAGGEGGEAKKKAVERINAELRKLKERCEGEGLGPEETLGRMLSQAEIELKAVPGLSETHRFSWVSREVEKRMLPREDV